MAAPVVQPPAVAPAAPAPAAAPATLSSWETGVNTYMVEFISNNLIDVSSYFGMKAGETIMNVVKAVALVFASLLLMPLAAAGWSLAKVKACFTSAPAAQPQAPPAQQPAAQQPAAQQPAAQQEVQQPAAQQPAAQQEVQPPAADAANDAEEV